MNIFYNLLAQANVPGQSFLGGQTGMIVMIIGMLAVFYFLIVMPQNKRKKAMEQMLNSMKSGDKVVTIGGIHGKVVSLKDNEIILKIDANVEITFDKSAIARVVKQESAVQKIDDKKK